MLGRFLAVGVVRLTVAAAMIVAVGLVHAFMQHLGAFKGMTVARGGAEDATQGGDKDGGGFHEVLFQRG